MNWSSESVPAAKASAADFLMRKVMIVARFDADTLSVAAEAVLILPPRCFRDFLVGKGVAGAKSPASVPATGGVVSSALSCPTFTLGLSLVIEATLLTRSRLGAPTILTIIHSLPSTCLRLAAF